MVSLALIETKSVYFFVICLVVRAHPTVKERLTQPTTLYAVTVN